MDRPRAAWWAAYVSARILALYLVAQTLADFSRETQLITQGFHELSTKYEVAGWAAAIFLAVVLWVYAEGVARLITGERAPWADVDAKLDEESSAQEEQTRMRVSGRSLLVIALAVLGAFFTVTGSTFIFNAFGNALSRRDFNFGRGVRPGPLFGTSDWLYLGSSVARIFLGAILFIYPRRIAARVPLEPEPEASE